MSHHPYDVAGHLPGGDADPALLDAADAVEQLANVTLPFYAAPLRMLVEHARATAGRQTTATVPQETVFSRALREAGRTQDDPADTALRGGS